MTERETAICSHLSVGCIVLQPATIISVDRVWGCKAIPWLSPQNCSAWNGTIAWGVVNVDALLAGSSNCDTLQIISPLKTVVRVHWQVSSVINPFLSRPFRAVNRNLAPNQHLLRSLRPFVAHSVGKRRILYESL